MAAMTANMLSVCVALVIICVVHCHLVPEDENTRQLGQVGSGFLVCVLFFVFRFRSRYLRIFVCIDAVI